MIDTLDSRALRHADSYGQRFTRPGIYRYRVLPVGGDCFTPRRPYLVDVRGAAPDGSMRRHSVTVRCEAGRFTVDRDVVVIAQGDLVTWQCADAGALPFSVVGETPVLSSDRIVNDGGFSHAFTAAGDYAWRDAHGSGAAGVVRVRDAWRRADADRDDDGDDTNRGTVVTIADGVAQPKEVSILKGQRVFFAVTKGPGISITDERLIGDAKRQSVS